MIQDFFDFIRGLLVALFMSEVRGWVRPLAESLARRAALKLPESHRDRLLQEWLAEIDHLEDRPFSLIRFSMGLQLTLPATLREIATSSDATTESQNRRATTSPLTDTSFEWLCHVKRHELPDLLDLFSGWLAGHTGRRYLDFDTAARIHYLFVQDLGPNHPFTQALARKQHGLDHGST